MVYARFSSLFIVVLALVQCSLIMATPVDDGPQFSQLSKRSLLCQQKNFGAPIAPWLPNSKPGWNVGHICKGLPSLPKWDGGDNALCNTLSTMFPMFATPFCKGKLTTCPVPSSWTCPSKVIPAPSNATTTSKVSSNSSSSSSSSSSRASSTSTISSSIGSSSSSSSTTSAGITSSTSTPTSTSSIVSPISTAPTVLAPICTGTSNTYQVVFTNYTTNATSGVYTGEVVGAATQDNSYITFGMVDSVTDCFTMCDGVSGCNFINTYHDNYDLDPTGQHDPTKLKCVLFGNCVDPNVSNNNWGGQDDPTYITDSNGYCRSGKCPTSF